MPRFLIVETHPAVHHMVSVVRGKLRCSWQIVAQYMMSSLQKKLTLNKLVASVGLIVGQHNHMVKAAVTCQVTAGTACCAELWSPANARWFGDVISLSEHPNVTRWTQSSRPSRGGP